MKQILYITILTILFSCSQAHKMSKSYHTNKSVDFNFEVMDENGESYNLQNLIGRGEVVYLDIWSTTCAPCIHQHTFLPELKENFKDYPIIFVHLATDSPVDDWKSISQKSKLKELNFLDTTSVATDKLKIKGWPTFILIGKEGNILGYDTASPSEKGVVDFVLYKAIRENQRADKSVYELFTTTILTGEEAQVVVRDSSIDTIRMNPH